MGSLLLLGVGPKGPVASGSVNRQAMIGASTPVFVNATVSRQSTAAGPVAVNES